MTIKNIIILFII
nr:orf365 [Phytophthora cinnamomi]AER36524.1 orf365 [Phytophthora cinnamomi]AER36538.1 orf365 [Phytophthora cinnamomi]AER36539.1 orf365 [Phytophthora cinnamomi]AER36540.1 orf365 [Phytophthora cinnamomi]